MSDSLLSVDVESAIRKLTDSQLTRPEMRAVELARVLCRCGARSLSMLSARDTLDVRARGAALDRDQLRLLVATHDSSRSSRERYGSLLRLEELGGLLWLALATDRGFTLSAQDQEGRIELDVAPGRTQIRVGHGGGEPVCRVLLRRRIRGSGEQDLLRDYLRHARFPVELDGEDLRRPSKTAVPPLSGTVQGSGFAGTVRIRVGEDFSRIRWIEHEVLSAERFSQIAGGVAHDAVIYASDSSVRTRAVIAVRDVREATVIGLHRIYDDLEEAYREPVRSVMFARAIDRSDLAVLGNAKVFQTVGGRTLSCAQLHELRTPVAVTNMDARRSSSAPTLLLDPQGRRLVTELLRIPIVGATRLSEGSVWQRARERATEAARAVQEGLGAMTARAIRGRPVPMEELRPVERVFMAHLSGLLREGAYRIPRLSPNASKGVSVEWVPRGPLPLRTLGGRVPRLQLPRQNRTVRRVLRAFEDDTSLIYPALDLLFAGRDGWGSRRTQWRRRWLRKD